MQYVFLWYKYLLIINVATDFSENLHCFFKYYLPAILCLVLFVCVGVLRLSQQRGHVEPVSGVPLRYLDEFKAVLSAMREKTDTDQVRNVAHFSPE